ncbi:MAG: 6-carboxytetrahydropterin synthase [Pseudomonadota bacterium]
MRIYKDFTFEAAHRLPGAPEGHPNSRIHGHSFRARVWVSGEPNSDTGVIFHFDELSEAISDARSSLDHHFLNDVDGLEVPTLENITVWLWNRLANRVPGLARIEVSRDSCHEGCVYDGPAAVAAKMAAE